MAKLNDIVAQAQHEGIGNAEEVVFQANPNKGAQWFLDGGNLGLFIHWGIASVDGRLDLSWPMMAKKPWDVEGRKHTVTPEYYFSLAKEFHPYKCDFKKMIRAAKECGHTYAVLTTRHHDGFALWPSSYGDFNTKNEMQGMDLVKLFVDACNQYNMKVGLYYSPPDWYRNRRYINFRYEKGPGAFNTYHELVDTLPTPPENWYKEEAVYVSNQIRELLTNYGKIDMLWFDGSIREKEHAISIEEIRKLQPSIVVTPRMHGKGDFKTFENVMPEQNPGEPWEFCTTWTEFSWGYNEDALPTFRPAKWAADCMKKAKSWNGNCLLNVSPNKNGELPEIVYQTFRELKGLF